MESHLQQDNALFPALWWDLSCIPPNTHYTLCRVLDFGYFVTFFLAALKITGKSRLHHGLKFYVIWGGCASSRLISGFSDCGGSCPWQRMFCILLLTRVTSPKGAKTNIFSKYLAISAAKYCDRVAVIAKRGSASKWVRGDRQTHSGVLNFCAKLFFLHDLGSLFYV